MKERFRRGDEIKIIGNESVFEGETGDFVRYETRNLDKKRLIVVLHSDDREHYFYPDEVAMKTPCSKRVFPLLRKPQVNRFEARKEVNK